MKAILRLVLFALLSTPFYAWASEPQDCSADGGLTFICGPQNAEDLVLVPGTKWILSSGMGEVGGIFLVDSIQKTWRQVYSDDIKHSAPDTKTYGSCSKPPAAQSFVTHGMHIRGGADGHSTLYVVGHGGREAIEVFDVDASASAKDPTFHWVGCVPMPEGLEANSVSSFRDGSLVATVLMHPGDSYEKMFAGNVTGAIYEWSPGKPEFSLIEGTRLPGNNGIEVSDDETQLFVASTGLRTVVAFARSNPSKVLRTSRVLGIIPDNVHKAADGTMLTAGTVSEQEGCLEPGNGGAGIAEFATCPRGFAAIKIDPTTMVDTEIAKGPANASFSNATMAIEVGDEVWVGTFQGDRIGIVPKR